MPTVTARALPHLLAILISGLAAGAEYHVDPAAPGGGSGSAAAPFATVAQALGLAVSGDTIWLHRGIYRESIHPRRSGSAAHPIVVSAWTPDGLIEHADKVTVTAAVRATPGSGGFGQWEALAGGRWRIQIPASIIGTKSAGNFHVTLDDIVLQDARWPDTTAIPDCDRASAATADDGGILAEDVGGDPQQDRGFYTLPGLDRFPTDSLAGSRMLLNPGKESAGVASAVIEHNHGDTVEFLWPRRGSGQPWNQALDPTARDWAVLWDGLAFLSRTDEFWIDTKGSNGPAGMLYLQQDASPAGKTLCFGTNNSLIDVSGAANLVFRGIELRGAGVQSDSSSANIWFDTMDFAFSAPGLSGQGSVNANGSHIRFSDCSFHDSNASALVLHSGGNSAGDISIDNSTFFRLRGSSIIPGFSDRVAMSHCTVADTGSHGVVYEAYQSRFSYLHVYHSGRLVADIAQINALGVSATHALQTRVDHNWVHSPRASRDPYSLRWLGCNGIRADSGGTQGGIAGVSIDHNLIWGDGHIHGIQIFTLNAGQIGGSDAAITVANNTIAISGTDNGSIDLVRTGNANGIHIVNNIASSLTLNDSIETNSTDLIIASNLLVDSAAHVPSDNATRATGRNLALVAPGMASATDRDFRLRPGSPAIAAGMVVSGITSGSAPDLGAIAYRQTPWISGAMVAPRWVPDLTARGVRSADGSLFAVLGHLPPGRLLPATTTLRIGNATLAAGSWRYDADRDQGEMWFGPLATAMSDGSAAYVRLAPSEREIALASPASGFSLQASAATWNVATQTLVIAGSGFYGIPWDAQRLAVDESVGGDLRQRPILALLDVQGRDPGLLDFIGIGGESYTFLDHHPDRQEGSLYQGWIVFPDAASESFGPAAHMDAYVTAHQGGGSRDHRPVRLSGAGPDGPPDRSYWPILSSPDLRFRWRPEDGPASGSAVLQLADRVGGAIASGSPGSSPVLQAGALSGLPGMAFAGGSLLTAAGPDTAGTLMMVGVYRNDFGSGASVSPLWQQLMSMGDQASVSAEYQPGGRPVAHATPTLDGRAWTTALATRSPLRLGQGPTSGHGFQGCLGEVLVCDRDSAVADATYGGDQYRNLAAASEYLAAKYGIRPTARLALGSGWIRSPTVSYGGQTLVLGDTSGGQMVFRVRDGGAAPGAWGPATVTLPGSRLQSAVTVIGDDSPPPTPTIASRHGAMSATPLFSGTTEPYAVVQICDAGIVIGTATAGPDGTWTWTAHPPLALGEHQITAIAVDASGNTSPTSMPVAVKVVHDDTGGGGGGSCGGGLALVALLAALLLPGLQDRRRHARPLQG